MLLHRKKQKIEKNKTRGGELVVICKSYDCMPRSLREKLKATSIQIIKEFSKVAGHNINV